MDLTKILDDQAQKYKSIFVDKFIDCDLGALMATDNNPLDTDALKNRPNEYLLELARDSAQLLVNQIFNLPTERVDNVIVAKLPKQKMFLPRFKPIPRPKPLTKWQQYAKEKGISKKKNSKATWDDQLQKWIPNYGFKKAAAEKDKDWVLEVPENANPMEDQFAKKATAKSENVAKNELQRLRNIAKAKNVKVPRFGLTNPDVASAKELQAAVSVAKASTASLGKFQDKLPKEKEARGIADIVPGSRKRKLAPIPMKDEKQLNLDIIEGVLSKRPKISVEKVVSKQINEEQMQRSEEKRSGGSSFGKQRKNNNKKNNALHSSGAGKKPKGRQQQNKGKKGGKGQRKGGKMAGGRKRR